MEVQALLTLLIIAERGEVAMSELQTSLDIGSSAMSRNVGKLGSTGYRNGTGQRKAEGLNLIETWENPDDRRVKLVRLTPKGRLAVARSLQALQQDG